MNNWIKASEQLPQVGLKVLAWVDHRAFTEPVFATLRHRWYVEGTNSEFPVTHWMELPRAPDQAKGDL